MKTIRTDSFIYKLYAAQVYRTTPYYEDDIADRPTNICDMGKRALFQATRSCAEVALLVVVVSFIIWLIMVPLLTFGFYLFTDNPFIVWFGDFGMAAFIVEGMMLIAGAIMGIVISITIVLQKSCSYLSSPQFISTWISNKSEGICTPLNIEVIDDDNS